MRKSKFLSWIKSRRISKTSWSILASSDLVPKEYVKERQELYDYYRPIEIDEVLESKKSESDYESLEEIVIKRNEALSVYKIVKLLEEPYKEVFILRTINQLSFQEIGQIYERKEVWARVTYHRARLKIQEKLGEEE